MRALEATARLGSVTRAAAELGRTHSAVSRQIRALQDQAGFSLFEKAGTGIRPTAAGQALRETVAGALDLLEQGWQRLLEEARGPSLHVACSATFAMRWLVPRLAGFYRRHPKVRVRLSMTSAREIRYQGADLVLAWDRAGYPEADQQRAIPVASVAFGPVCAPGYPATVKNQVLTCATRIAHEHTTRAWDLWQAAAGLRLEHTAELLFPHTHLCIEVAISGLGLALLERRMVHDDLAAGRLVAPCGFLPFADGLAAVPAAGRALSPAAQAFLAWICDALAWE
ncbi:LysR family transcriptional regulator [Paracraurococcus lichenis]|uniref:LysR substrate-binding domain-containing protein n=1 Tax=Paracraurococcus lichenis TaxID=3064888 RepID=A0ABT9EA72_9PROT|nr:LysR substrate-binding domain-containing protein [Paracraurococcus sp. LOR1-02]MDO9713056.1 LysR substrate-binding domain-containing protein [Paracraurococcus sp. LOR1-02]